MSAKMELDLSLIDHFFVTEAQRNFDDGDAIGLLCKMSNEKNLPFVFDNACALKERGVYEKSLLHALTATRTNHHGWDPSVIRFLVGFCDRPKLLAAGEPLPNAGPFTVFRGVAGKGKSRRIRGLSWTDDLTTACWFSRRFDLPDPAIYVATIKADDVYAVHNGRNEREFLCDVRVCKRMRISVAEIESHAASRSKLVSESQAKRLAEAQSPR